MIGMRLLSLLAGGLALLVVPMVMFDSRAGMSGWIVAPWLLGLILTAASFFYVGAAGKRMRRGGQERLVGGALLAVALVASLLQLVARKDPAGMLANGGLLAFSILLLFNFVFVPTMARRQRPMRERERHDAVVRHFAPVDLNP